MDKIRTLLWGVFVLLFVICLNLVYSLERLSDFHLVFTLFMMFVAALFAFGSIIRPEKSDKNNCCNKKCPLRQEDLDYIRKNLEDNNSTPNDF